MKKKEILGCLCPECRKRILGEEEIDQPTLNEYRVEIEEVFCKTVKIKASSEEDAISTVQSLYNTEQIVLTADDHISTDFGLAECDVDDEKTEHESIEKDVKQDIKDDVDDNQQSESSHRFIVVRYSYPSVSINDLIYRSLF